MDGPECRIIIESDRVVSYQVSRYGGSTKGALLSTDERSLVEMTIERLSYWVSSQSGACKREDLQVLGLHLYRLLFADPKIREAFENDYATFKREFDEEREREPNRLPKLRFRVVLVFLEKADTLASYPWEFLFVPVPSSEQGFFLAGERMELILTRFVGEPQLVKKLQIETNELRVLVVRSQPNELDTLGSVETVVGEIEKLQEPNRIRVKTMMDDPRPTQKDLTELVSTFKPHIVHFIGHGRAGKIALIKQAADMEFEKALNGKCDEANWVDSDTMRAVFASLPRPSLVFLDACNTANMPETFTTFKSTARQLLHAEIPAVVAMQFEISNEDSRDFAREFYKQIGNGTTIGEAVKEGRMKLGAKNPAWSHPRFGTPVVYLQTDGSAIFAKERVQESVAAGAPSIRTEPSGKQDCPYPDCNLKVVVDQKRCGCERRNPLARCPNPSCGRVIPRGDTDCMFCEFKLTGPEPASATTSAPGSVASVRT